MELVATTIDLPGSGIFAQTKEVNYGAEAMKAGWLLQKGTRTWG